MSRARYVVRCTVEGCQEPVKYKIAAEWSDRTIRELKTYGLACERHLELLYRRSCAKQVGYRLAEGETLGAPEIFQIEEGRRDRDLTRLSELEARYQ